MYAVMRALTSSSFRERERLRGLLESVRLSSEVATGLGLRVIERECVYVRGLLKSVCVYLQKYSKVFEAHSLGFRV